MARCIKSEKEGRMVFYGSMIIEGILAMIWASVAMNHFGSIKGLAGAGAAPVVVSTVCMDLLGPIVGTIAVIGVVLLPITSGDTAFRACRLILADALKMEQRSFVKRLYLALPLFAVGISLSFVDFGVIWRYFAWSNQTLATIALWASAVYLKQYGKPYWIAYVPALFMTVVVTSYIVVAKEGLQLPYNVGIIAGFTTAALFATLFHARVRSERDEIIDVSENCAVS
jgi:carbon starvation protein CstA